ncbi:uncharacterized protein [Hetaerina americana]|uniref:uncharacterized protein n=1 Tax=Hetaerina americana TaxID=62018 RepID=UPI003A7F2F66
MRLTPTRILWSLCVMAMLAVVWCIIHQLSGGADIWLSGGRRVAGTGRESIAICKYPDEFQERLHDLMQRTHVVLSSLALTHFLCYGSLWAQIRIGRIFPWSSHGTFCLLDEELADLGEAVLLKAFRRNGIYLSYDPADGVYTAINDVVELPITNSEPVLLEPSIQLYAFEKDVRDQGIGWGWEGGMTGPVRRRVGWKRRLLPPDCAGLANLLQCFPERLILAPSEDAVPGSSNPPKASLPMASFGGLSLPVPFEGLEIQKYHYPDNWWKVINPENC